MDKFNIILIILIFTSLVVIIGIFGKNLKNFKQAEKSLRLRDELGKKKKKERKFSFAFIFSKISGFFVWIAETFVSGASTVLKAAHSGLLEIKAKNGSMKNSSEKSTVESEVENRDFTDKITEERSVKVKSKLGILKNKFSKNDIKTSTEGIFAKKQKSTMNETEKDVLDEIDYKKEDDKNNKLKDFFGKNPNNKHFEQEQEFEDLENEETQDKKDILKKSFFRKINPFKKEEDVKGRKILTEETYNDFSDGITVINKDFSGKEEDVFMKDVVRAKHTSQKDVNNDDELGVDRKILEKRILQKIAANPKDIEGYRQLGELYIKMENFDDAHSAYKFILKVSARDVDASRKLEKIKLLKRLR